MKFDLSFHQGEDVSITIGLSKDYTGYSTRMQARAHPSDVDVLFEISPTIGDDGDTMIIEIPKEDTSDFDWTSAVYDIEVTSPEDKVTFPVFGIINVRKRVTR